MINSNDQSQTYIDPNYAAQTQEVNNFDQQNYDINQDQNIAQDPNTSNNQYYDEHSNQYDNQNNNQPKFKQYDNLYQQYNQSYLQTGEYFPKKRPIFRWEFEYLKNDSMNFEDSEFYNLLHFEQIQNQETSSNSEDFSDLEQETPSQTF